MGADGGCVTGTRRQHHAVLGAQVGVAGVGVGVGVEYDPAAHAVQHLGVAVLMPVVGIARAVPQRYCARPSARIRATICVVEVPRYLAMRGMVASSRCLP